MNIKNFFPNIPDEDFNGFKEALIESGLKLRQANNLAKYVMKSVEKTACGFSMLKEEEQFTVFETFIEMFGQKQGAKKFQEHIEQRRKEFEKIQEKFPGIKKISDKY